MSLFGYQFYPTPKSLAFELFDMYGDLVEDLERENKYGERLVRCQYDTVFEPSAGKGDLAEHYKDYLKDKGVFNFSRKDVRFKFCEIDPNLKHILYDKGSVVGDDFLQYNDIITESIIIMNPPFANGAQHVLHAWDIMHNGPILAILNAQTLKNPHTYERKKLLDIIQNSGGEVKYVQGAFEQAERTANVEVALVYLFKESTFDSSAFDFAFEKEDISLDFDQITTSQELAFAENKLVLYERMYNESKRLFSDALVSFTKLRRCLQAFGAGTAPLDAVSKVSINSSSDYATAYASFLETTKAKAWEHILSQGNFRSRLDSRTQQDFSLFVKQQQNMAYSAKNIIAVFEMIVNNQDLYQQKAIETAFDFMTRYHSENCEHFEGWKTNDAFKVKRKIILPGGCQWGEYLTGSKTDKFSTPYGYYSEWSDIDKAMCIVAGIHQDNITGIRDTLDRKFRILGYVGSGPFDNECENRFFKMKFYKKGTVHLTFKSEELLDRFNRFACEGRGWLPPSKPHAEAQPESSEETYQEAQGYLREEKTIF